MAAGRDEVGGGGRDELAERRRERIIERTRLAMAAAGEPAARVARANASVAKARRTLKRGAAELVAQGFVRGAPGQSCVPDGEIGWWVDLGFCRAVTASGARCKAPATAEDGWCGQHRAGRPGRPPWRPSPPTSAARPQRPARGPSSGNVGAGCRPRIVGAGWPRTVRTGSARTTDGGNRGRALSEDRLDRDDLVSREGTRRPSPSLRGCRWRVRCLPRV